MFYYLGLGIAVSAWILFLVFPLAVLFFFFFLDDSDGWFSPY